MPYFTGRNARVGIAINGDNSGTTFDGTAGTADYIPIRLFGYVPRQSKNIAEELTSNPEHKTDGGLYYTWSLSTSLSYAYLIKLLHLYMGGSVSDSGSGPYDHAVALSDELLFGELYFEHTDQAANANEIILETFANVAVTSLNISQAAEQVAILTAEGIAVSKSRSTSEASLTSVNTLERVDWDHLTVNLNGTSTYHLRDLELQLGRPLSEGEFDLAASSPDTLDFIAPTGMREVGLSFGIAMDSTAYTLINDGGTDFTGTNSLVWNNGGAGAAERELSIVLGDGWLEDPGRTIDTIGREVLSGVSAKFLDDPSGTRILDVDIKNGRETTPS